ncbi:hypothetical protein GN956_G23627 [Arapaima gigas]
MEAEARERSASDLQKERRTRETPPAAKTIPQFLDCIGASGGEVAMEIGISRTSTILLTNCLCFQHILQWRRR